MTITPIGQYTAPGMAKPVGITVGGDEIFVADQYTQYISVFDATTRAFKRNIFPSDFITVLDDPIGVAYLDGVLWVSVANGKMAAVDAITGTVIGVEAIGAAPKIVSDETTSTLYIPIGSVVKVYQAAGGSATLVNTLAGGMSDVSDVAIDGNGNVYAADRSSSKIHRFDANGSYLSSWGTQGTGPDQLERVESVTISEDRVYVANIPFALDIFNLPQIKAYYLDGTFIEGYDWPEPGIACPADMVVVGENLHVTMGGYQPQYSREWIEYFGIPFTPQRPAALCETVPLPAAEPGQVTMIVAGLVGTATLEADCTCDCSDICPPEPIVVEEVPPDNIDDPVADDDCAVDIPVVDPDDGLTLFERTLQQAGMAEGGWYVYAQKPYPDGNVSHNDPPQDAYDFLVPLGTPIHSPSSGTVVYTNLAPEARDQIGGWSIIVQADASTYLYYGHIDTSEVALGDTVLEDDLIASVGLTGMGDPAVNRYGSPHLHFQSGFYDIYPSTVTVDQFLESIGFTLPPFVSWDEIGDNLASGDGPTYR